MSTDIGRRVRRIVTTEELHELLVAGKKVRLRPVARPAAAVLEHYGPADLDDLGAATDGAVISSVEHVRDEQVQCIAVDHPDHLYLTDAFIPTHNTSNIIFLKSTDDSMIETLEKMSGKTHKVYRDGKSVTKNMEQLVQATNIEAKVNYSYSVKEEPVISYNDMAFINERNSVVFRAGDPPVWNRRETILPMSFALFGGKGENSIIKPGKDYSLQTIPTLSSAVDFDVRQNQPDFVAMLNKRMLQAERAAHAKTIYADAFGYNDYGVSRLDPDVYSDEVMNLIQTIVWENLGLDPEEAEELFDPMKDEYTEYDNMVLGDLEDNTGVNEIVAERVAENEEYTRKRYAKGRVSRGDMTRLKGEIASHPFDDALVKTFIKARPYIAADGANFRILPDGSLSDPDGTILIEKQDSERLREELKRLKSAASDEAGRVYAEDEMDIAAMADVSSYEVTDELYLWLASLPTWSNLAKGQFEAEFIKAFDNMSGDDNMSEV